MFKNDELYKVENNTRIYNIYDVNEIDLMCSELSIFCNNWVNDGGNLFFIKCSPNNNISLTKKEIDYIYLLDQNCKNFEYLDFNNNIDFLMENQKNDLLLLNLENINYFFLIPEFDSNNCYYFNLFISFKDVSSINNLLNLNFNIIRIDSINNIKHLSFLDIKTIFNFNNNMFAKNKFDYRFIDILNIDYEKKKIDIKPLTDEEWDERITNFLKQCVKDSDINKSVDLKLEIKEILSKYLEKPDVNNQLKKISYFFYWNIDVPDSWHRSEYSFVLDDDTGYSVYYSNRINILCKEFKLNTFLKQL